MIEIDEPAKGRYLNAAAKTLGLKRYVEQDEQLRARLIARLRNPIKGTKDSLWYALRDAMPGLGFVVEENPAWFKREGFWSKFARFFTHEPAPAKPAQVIVRVYVPSGAPFTIARLSDVINSAVPLGLTWQMLVNAIEPPA